MKKLPVIVSIFANSDVHFAEDLFKIPFMGISTGTAKTL